MVTSETTWRGGEVQLLLLMRGLLDDGHAVHLAAPARSEIRRRGLEMNVPTHTLSISAGMDLVASWRLRRLISGQGYDIVHAHSSHAHSVMYMALAGVRDKPHQVVSRRVMFESGSNALSRRKYRDGADMFLAISQGVRGMLRRGGVPDARIQVVPSGIELDKYALVRDNAYLKTEFGIDADAVVVGTIGALTDNKSQTDLIAATPALQDQLGRRRGLRVLLVGEGEARPRLESEVARLGLGKVVTLTGFRSDALELLSLFDCFVMPSREEGLCTSIMDAQAMGVGVVATNTGGIPELVTDQETGLLVPVGRSDALATAIVRMCSDDNLRNRCITGARRKSAGYDYRQMVYNTVGAYRALAAR